MSLSRELSLALTLMLAGVPMLSRLRGFLFAISLSIKDELGSFSLTAESVLKIEWPAYLEFTFLSATEAWRRCW